MCRGWQLSHRSRRAVASAHGGRVHREGTGTSATVVTAMLALVCESAGREAGTKRPPRSVRRQSATQNARSAFVSWGRLVLSCTMASCCRKARFSSAKYQRSRDRQGSEEAQVRLALAKRASRKGTHPSPSLTHRSCGADDSFGECFVAKSSLPTLRFVRSSNG